MCAASASGAACLIGLCPMIESLPPVEPQAWAEMRLSPTQNLALLLAVNQQTLSMLDEVRRLYYRQLGISVLWVIVAAAWTIQAVLLLVARL